MDNEKQILVMRVMALGIFPERDRHALRLMSANTLNEIIRTADLPQHPVVRANVFRVSIDRRDGFIPDNEIARDMARIGRH